MPSEPPKTRLTQLPVWRTLFAVVGTMALVEIVGSFWPSSSTASHNPNPTTSSPQPPTTPTPAEPIPEPTPHPAEPAAPLLSTNPFSPLTPTPPPAPAPVAFTLPPPPKPLGSTPLPIYDPTAILDTTAATHLRNGNTRRETGDHLGALSEYNLALDLLPGHPRIIFEVASTYDLMGKPEKAAGHWSQIYRLGSSGGELFFVADSKLRTPDGSAILTEHRPVAIASVVAVPEPTTSGQRIAVHVSLKNHPGTTIDASLLEAHVLFYDKVNGNQIAQTTADPPSSRWLSGPAVDWLSDPEEVLEVIYFHPQMTPAERARFGTRAYHGCIIKLYYDNQLVDQTAEPRPLLEYLFEHEPAPSEIDSTLFGDFGNH